LQALLDGEADAPALTAHLDGCPECQAALERLARGDMPIPNPRLASEPKTGETVLHRLMEELKEPPPDGGADDDFALDFLIPSDRPGSLGRFGKYEIEQIIGRGGMGIVLRALDTELNRLVAIKVIAPAFAASGAMRRRFAREARAAAAVCHDHVVTIHHVDTSGHPPYLVMQYVPGPSLQERLDQSVPLELKEILRIGMQTAAGLGAAHAHGLIHRDIKPANILLEDDMERVKLTDFGLARASDDVRITQSAVLAGTPQYMAPEQARGELLDPRADLFSLGCVLYTMCTGRPPFRAGTPLAVMKRICEDTPRSIRHQNPNIPAWLETIIMKLLEKDPAERFQSAAEVSDLLGRCLAHVQQPRRVPLPPIPLRKKTPPRRTAWRRPLAMAAAFLALLVCGLGATVITVRTNQGTLVIEVNDPAVKVTVEGDDVLINGIGLPELRLRPGDYKVKATKDGKAVDEQPVTITRGGKAIVTVRNELPSKIVAQEPVDLPRTEGGRVSEAQPVLKWKAKEGSLTTGVYSADGKLIAVGSDDGAVRLMNAATGKLMAKFAVHRARIIALRFLPEGKALVSVSADGVVKFWDVLANKETGTLDLPMKPNQVAFSGNGAALAAAASNLPIKVWATRSGREVASLESSVALQALAFSPDGRTVAASIQPGLIWIWEVSSRKVLRTLSTHTPGTAWPWVTQTDHSLAFSPDGKALACSTGESVVRLWDLATGREIRALAGHKGAVEQLVFSADGRRLLSASQDKVAILWDVATGKEILRLGNLDNPVLSAAISPDGSRVLTITGDGTLWREVPVETRAK
jgi:serine/threonine protein kinase